MAADIEIWERARDELAAGRSAMMIVIVDAEGHVPNGPGAKCLVLEDGSALGTVGGGGAERELIEEARAGLGRRGWVDRWIEMHHHPEAEGRRSGMLCSGRQTFLLVRLAPSDGARLAALIRAHRDEQRVRLVFDPRGLALEPDRGSDAPLAWHAASPAAWRYAERIGEVPVLTIIGGGHVSLALSRVARPLGFRVRVLDDRSDLPTMQANEAATEKQQIDFATVAQHVPEGDASYACIMTHGHQADEDVLAALLPKDLAYLGMLGSEAKVRTIFDHLAARGVARAALSRVHAPIGVSIGSRTPEEIAISIAAELIRIRNG